MLVLLVLIAGVAVGFLGPFVWGFVRGVIRGRQKVAAGKMDSRDSENILKVSQFFMSDRPVTPRIRIALQALIDRIEEPVETDVPAEESPVPADQCETTPPRVIRCDVQDWREER